MLELLFKDDAQDEVRSMGGLTSHRGRRLLASGSPILLAGGTAMIGIAIAILNHSANDKSTPYIAPGISRGLLIIAIVGVVLLLMQWRTEYRRRTHDPTWALKFQDDFDSDKMQEIRSRAAKALKELHEDSTKLHHMRKETPDIDDVLDFFEDVGFYLQGDQITPEVAHHAFYYWICRYYSATRNYVEDTQKARPSQWEFLKGLFETTNELEIERHKGKAQEAFDKP